MNRRSYPQRRYQKRTRKPKDPSISILQTVERNVNDSARLQFIQGLLDTHAPGATASWPNAAYLVISGDDVKALFSNAFMNLDGVKLVGLKITGIHPTGGSMMVGYRQGANDQLRIISGITKIKAGFIFKDGELPQTLVLIGQTSCSFKLRVSYKNALVKSLL